MIFGRWIRRLFSSPGDEAAQREEYGTPDRGDAHLERDRFGSFAEVEGGWAAQDELGELSPPRDEAP